MGDWMNKVRERAHEPARGCASVDAGPRRRVGVEDYLLDGGALLYDKHTKRVVRLTADDYMLWTYCDGATPPAEIAKRQPGVDAQGLDAAIQRVEQALAYLSREGLLCNGSTGD